MSHAEGHLWAYSPQPRQSAKRVLSMRWEVECSSCYGAGWFPDGEREAYCDCEAAKWRRIHDSPEIWP